MNLITAQQKTLLSEMLAEGHRKFGKVAPRRPYADDEDDRGAGSGLLLEHPLFMDQPIGAPEETPIASANSNAEAEAQKRSDELTMTVQNKLGNQLGAKKEHIAELQPYS